MRRDIVAANAMIASVCAEFTKPGRPAAVRPVFIDDVLQANPALFDTDALHANPAGYQAIYRQAYRVLAGWWADQRPAVA